MKRIVTLIALAGLGVCLAPAAGRSAPEPSLVPRAWQLEYQPQSPASIRVNVPGQGERTFWYVLYTVTNNTGQDVMFVPEFTLYTDSGQLLRAGHGVPPSVFNAIVLRHNNPLLQDPNAVVGPLLQGEDNAKDGVAVFTDIDPIARQFDLFVAGLSGEVITEKLPIAVQTTQVTDDGQVVRAVSDEITLRKTLDLGFALPGEAAARAATTVRKLSEKWIMR